MLLWKLDGESLKKSTQRRVFENEVQNANNYVNSLNTLDPSLRAEFARSWLEGRLIEDSFLPHNTKAHKRRTRGEGGGASTSASVVNTARR